MTLSRRRPDPVELLDRYIYYREREDVANHKHTLHGDSTTGERYAATAGRWGDKASRVESDLREILMETFRGSISC